MTEYDLMKGNGKAKKRRPIEREYLATLNAAVPLDTWQAICKRAADDESLPETRSDSASIKAPAHTDN